MGSDKSNTSIIADEGIIASLNKNVQTIEEYDDIKDLLHDTLSATLPAVLDIIFKTNCRTFNFTTLYHQ